MLVIEEHAYALVTCVGHTHNFASLSLSLSVSLFLPLSLYLCACGSDSFGKLQEALRTIA